MKKFLVALICLVPLSLFAETGEQNKTLMVFQKLCKSEQDPNLREKYCQQVENVKKADRIINGFQNQQKQG